MEAPPPAVLQEVGPTREPWRDPPGPITEAASGLQLELPSGWQIRPGRGALPWEAKHAATGATLYLGTWTGNAGELEQRYDDRPLGFAARGTEARLEALADGPPRVASREAPGGLRVGWYMWIDGRPVAIEAVLPAAATEASWRAVLDTFDGLQRGVAGT